MNLTTIITIKEFNNLENCFNSIKKLPCKFIALDCINSNQTNLFCKIYNIEHHDCSKFIDDYSSVKNYGKKLCKTNWIFFIDSNEILISGLEKVINIVSSKKETSAYSVSTLNEYTITKEVRLIQNLDYLKFVNGHYESIISKSEVEDIYLSVKSLSNNKNILSYFIDQEEKHPSNNTIKYYVACSYLSCNMIKEFITKAEEFLFLSKKNEMPQIMINYYLSLVKCVKKLNLQDALKHISICILYKPDMAEFWCCIGDIFYQSNNIKKAITFYKIAISAGKKRRKKDSWPLEIKKYVEYPKKMIENCDKLNKNRKEYKNI